VGHGRGRLWDFGPGTSSRKGGVVPPPGRGQQVRSDCFGDQLVTESDQSIVVGHCEWRRSTRATATRPNQIGAAFSVRRRPIGAPSRSAAGLAARTGSGIARVGRESGNLLAAPTVQTTTRGTAGTIKRLDEEPMLERLDHAGSEVGAEHVAVACCRSRTRRPGRRSRFELGRHRQQHRHRHHRPGLRQKPKDAPALRRTERSPCGHEPVEAACQRHSQQLTA
jgi:hypothetical protein